MLYFRLITGKCLTHMVETQSQPKLTSHEQSAFTTRAQRAFTVGAGKERGELYAKEDITPTGVWGKDASIRGYAIDGWKGMAEAMGANAVVGGGALALDQLEKVVVGDFLLKETKGLIERKHERPSDFSRNAHWESPWISVVDNVEETASDMVINFAAKKAVNAVMKNEKDMHYASPLADVISDGVNLATFIFGKTTPVQKLGLTYAKIRNSVNATDVESAMRMVNVLPVVGALAEKYMYTPMNHALEHNKVVQGATSWTMKSAVWFIIGMLTNGASERTANSMAA